MNHQRRDFHVPSDSCVLDITLYRNTDWSCVLLYDRTLVSWYRW